MAEPESEAHLGRLEEREARQQGVQQHGDTFAVDPDEPTDTSGTLTERPTESQLPSEEPTEADTPSDSDDR